MLHLKPLPQRMFIWISVLMMTGLLIAGEETEKTQKKPVHFFPVMGNHDISVKHRAYLQDTVMKPIRDLIHLRYDKPVNGKYALDYYFDHKNIRFIVVDQYKDKPKLKTERNLNEGDIVWMEEVIKEAMPQAGIDHIFISYHEPSFPRGNHSEVSDHKRKIRESLWNMLMKYKGKVRAVFVGHTHSYNRLRISDPTKADKPVVDHPGGIYEIDCAGTGLGGTKGYAVFVNVDGPKLKFLAIKTLASDKSVKTIDQWNFTAEGESSYKGESWCFSAVADTRIIGSKKNAKSRERLEWSKAGTVFLFEEIRDMKHNPHMGWPEFVVNAGDLSITYTYGGAWKQVFEGKEKKVKKAE